MEEKHTVIFGIKKQTALIGVGIIILLLVLLLLGVLMLLASNENGTVIVRGEVLANIPIRLDPPEQNILVPFVMILRELGYEITQQDQNILILADDDQKYILNLEELSLFEYGEPTVNYLEIPRVFTTVGVPEKGMTSS